MAEFEVQKGHIFRHFLSILQQFWECRFLTQNGPDSPQNHPQGFQFSYNLLYDISIFHRSIENLLEGRFWGGNCLKKAKIGKFCISIVRPNLFNMVKYALDAVRRITVPTVLIPHPQKIKTPRIIILSPPRINPAGFLTQFSLPDNLNAT